MAKARPSEFPFVPVVMCGGSGSRLRPLSRAQKTKPFLPLPGGGTLIGELLGSLADSGCAGVVCVTGEKQLGDAQASVLAAGLDATVVVEPTARGTAPALAAAVELIAAAHGDEAVFAMMPADHHVRDRGAFADAVRLAATVASAEGRLVVLGVEPTHPATGYGYVKAGEAGGDGWARVDSFVEKPDEDRARAMIGEGGHYWNAGVFVATATAMRGEFAAHAPEVGGAAAALDPGQAAGGLWRVPKAGYEAFPDVSVDYAVAERTGNAAVVPVAGSGWGDIGSWPEFMGLVEADGDGNRGVGDTLFEGSRDSGAYSVTGRKVVVAGCEGVVAVDLPDALLVAGRGSEGHLRAAHAALAAAGERCVDSPAHEARPWGSYRQLGSGEGWQAKRIEVAPGRRLSLQSHERRAERWTVVEGVMTVTVGDEVRDLAVGESCEIPVGARHRMENRTDEAAVLIEVQLGSYLGEDDIVRYEDDFGRS